MEVTTQDILNLATAFEKINQNKETENECGYLETIDENTCICCWMQWK